MPVIVPLSPANRPARIVQSAWLEHGPFAYWIVDALKPRLIVELGSHNGYSFCCFLEQVRRSHIDGRAIAIDTWKGDDHAGGYGDDVYDNLNAYVARNYADIAEMKRMYFSEALPSVADGSVDLLHVDGRHFYDDVVEDFTSWIPKLSDRAVVLFHDTQVRERGFGVYRYWSELAKTYSTFEFHHGHGLGVLGFGKQVPADVMALFAETPDAARADAIRTAFAARGAEISQAWRRKNRLPRAIQKIKRAITGLTMPPQ